MNGIYIGVALNRPVSVLLFESALASTLMVAGFGLFPRKTPRLAATVLVHGLVDGLHHQVEASLVPERYIFACLGVDLVYAALAVYRLRGVRDMSLFTIQDDAAVVAAAQAGEPAAMSEIVSRHRAWVYNISLKMLGDCGTAEDATQDIFIKVLQRIGSFQGRSAFRTWLYRVAFHHLLNLKRTRFETAVGDFENYELGLKHTPNMDLDDVPEPERAMLLEEAKTVCMTGMLLCLQREQRLAFVLGAIFGLSHKLAAEILDVQPATFRKRLSRARNDLGNFMQSNCGLINPDNPCRCSKKTKVFMNAGYLDRNALMFQRDRIASIGEVAQRDAGVLYEKLNTEFPQAYREHAFSDPNALRDRLAEMLQPTSLGTLIDPSA